MSPPMNQISPLFDLHSCFKVNINSIPCVSQSSDYFPSIRSPTKIVCISHFRLTPHSSYSFTPLEHIHVQTMKLLIM